MMNPSVPAGTPVQEGDRRGVVVDGRPFPWHVWVRWEDETEPTSAHIDDIIFP
jgi:hypothetical protein